MLLTVGVLFYLQASSPGLPGGGGDSHENHAANSDNPGQEIEVKSLLEKGKTNIVDFYSDYCGPCRRISPLLVKLDQKEDNIVVIKLDINRSGKRGIDWFSPLVKQYGIRSVPHFQIYDTNGKLTHEGRAAYQEVGRLLTSAGIIQ
jgi:thiol-disulfide isomerase/thioredoxin